MRFICLFFAVIVTAGADAQNISGIVNIYRKVLWADSAKGEVKLTDVSGFAGFGGRKAMIIQMKGASMNGGANSTDPSFGNINAINGAGFYETGTICGFKNDTMVFERKLNNFYDYSSGAVQCVILPLLTGNVTVTDTLKAAPWDNVADTGGVLAIEVPGTLLLNKPVSATGAGFRGGTYTQFGSTCNFNPLSPPTDYYMSYLANNIKTGGYKGEGLADYISGREYARGNQVNGGGGGNNHNAGGGGGSNYNSGGIGGERITNTVGQCKSTGAGRGGIALNTWGYSLSPVSKNKIFLGGGGGAGHDNDGYGMPGGNGGGIVLIIANSIQGNSATLSDNKIMANGTLPYRFLGAPFFWSTASVSDGSGGGGGAGVVILKVNSFAGNSVLAEAKGAAGGNSEIGGNAQCSGPGGGGGGGVVWFSAASLQSGVTSDVSGGTAGIVQQSVSACNGSTNGATAGSNGSTLFNFSFATPRDSSPVCKAIVPLNLLVSITGQLSNNHRLFRVAVSNNDNAWQCILQKAAPAGNFTDIGYQPANGSGQYVFTDFADMTAVYRAKLICRSGVVVYSPVIRFNGVKNDQQLQVDVFPNPATATVNIQLYLPETGVCGITISDGGGRKLQELQKMMRKGINSFSLAVNELPAGLYFIKISGNYKTATRIFVKSPR